MANEIGKLTQIIEADQGRLAGSLRAAEAKVRTSANVMEQSLTKGLKFEKLGQLTRQAGAVALAVGTNSTSDSAFDQNIAKAEQLALTLGSFAGPKGQLISLGFVAIAEGVRFLNRQFSDPAAKEYAKQLEAARAAESAKRQQIKDRLSGLQEEIDLFGKSAAEIEEYKLRKMEASDADVVVARQRIEQLELLKKEKDAQQDAARAAEQRAERESAAYMEAIESERQLANERARNVQTFLQSINAAAAVPAQRPGIAAFGSQQAIRVINESEVDDPSLKKLDQVIDLLDDIERNLGIKPQNVAASITLVNF